MRVPDPFEQFYEIHAGLRTRYSRSKAHGLMLLGMAALALPFAIFAAIFAGFANPVSPITLWLERWWFISPLALAGIYHIYATIRQRRERDRGDPET